MRTPALLFLSAMLLLVVVVANIDASPSIVNPPMSFTIGEERNGSTEGFIDEILQAAQRKRSCVPSGEKCENRVRRCCNNTSCLCNSWGANCRCQPTEQVY